jgi:hypothetical protein
MKSVAIVGFSHLTLPYLKYSKADEIWTMNHVLFVEEIPRVDRLFEIHKRSWYLRGEQQKSKIYSRWLKKEHLFPIYMQEAELDPKLIPSGVRYPLEEICDKLLVGLERIDYEAKKVLHDKYFTSTASFMIALAIYEEFDKIELFGVDCDSDTEYGYQKPAVEFWLGLALGRGIKVTKPVECSLCVAPLYGFDVVPYIDKLHVKAVVESYQDKHKILKRDMEEAAKAVYKDPNNPDNGDSYLEKSAWVYLYEGAISAGGRLMQTTDSYISKQFLEIQKADYMGAMEYWKALGNTLKGQVDLAGKDKVPEKVWIDYLNGRASMFACQGAVELHNRLMKTIDFRKVDWDLTMDIVED